MNIRAKSLLSLGFAAGALSSGCQAPLHLDKYDVQSESLTQRYDAYQSAGIQGDTAIILGNDGVVVEMNTKDPTKDKRIVLKSANGDALPAFIGSASCPDGRFYALSTAADIWERQNDGEWRENKIDTREFVQDIQCAQNGDLWVSASFSTLYHSKDAGKSWDETSQDEDSSFTQMSFPAPGIGYAFGEFGMVLKTEDAGENWTLLEGVTPEFYPLSAYFKNENEGWVGSLRGSIYKTIDGGHIWTRETVDSQAPIYRITQIDDHLVALGNYGTFLSLQYGKWSNVKKGAPATFGYLRALTASAGENPAIFVGGQGFAARIPMNNIELDKAQ